MASLDKASKHLIEPHVDAIGPVVCPKDSAGCADLRGIKVERASIQDWRQHRQLLTAPGAGAGGRVANLMQPLGEQIAPWSAARAPARDGVPALVP